MIRLLTPEDFALWKPIYMESVHEHPEALDDTYEEAAALHEGDWRRMLHDSHVFAYMNNEQPVGLAGYFFTDRIKLRHRAKIFGVYVKAEFRGRGIMDWLLGALEYHARNAGFEQLHLNVGSFNERALRCYERNGYAVYATEPRMLKLDGHYIDEYSMMKFL